MQQLRQSANLVIVPENRPFMLGLKRNCPALKRDNIRFVYCNDNALSLLFYKGKIIKTMIFYKEKKDQALEYDKYQSKPKSKFATFLESHKWIFKVLQVEPPHRNVYNELINSGWHVTYEDNLAIILEKK